MGFKIISLICLTGMALSAEAAYQKVSEKSLFNSEKVVEYRLDNGLRVLVVRRTSAEVLSFQTWFDIGSIDEKLNPKLKKTGLAHLFEHMMFRGTQRYPDGKFDSISSRLGVDHQNASTYFYRTNYYQNIPSNKLEMMLDLESDRMANLNLTTELLEKEKGAVVGELRRIQDSPMSLAHDEMNRLAFEKAPYQYTVIGTEAEIKGFTLEEAQYFYHTFYAPNNATLIFVGNVDEPKLMELVEKYYGPMKRQEIPKLAPEEEPAQNKERRRVTSHRQATSEILLVGYRYPGINSPDLIPLSLLGSHLSVGTESRLQKSLVDKGIAVRASAGWGAQPDLFQFTVQLTDKHKAEEALKIIDREIDLLKKAVIGPQPFERALNQELLSLYMEIGDISAMGNLLGEYLMLSGSYLKGFEIIEGYKKLHPVDLQQIAKKYLNKDNRSVVIIRPGKKDQG